MLTSPGKNRALLFVLTGWAVFFVLWTLFILGWGQGEVAIHNAALSGLIVTGVASIFGVVVWKLTGKVAWPDKVSFKFFLLHLLCASIFSLAWTIAVPVVGTLLEGGSISELEWTLQNYSWRLLMGFWLYVIVAGLSYAARINQRLRQQQQRAAQAEALAAEANLAAMRSQLQPHFLFNALHSVSALIETDPPRAADAMEMLGDLLRYAIRDRESQTVTLREEWRFVADYVALQKIRFGDSIHVDMDMNSDLSSAAVPPFILQPVVENAFIHGLSPRASGGVLQIKAAASNDRLILTVNDNGDGSANLASDQPSFLKNDQTSTGTGLDNLRHRLKALYSDTAGVNIRMLESGGTEVQVFLPLNLDP